VAQIITQPAVNSISESGENMKWMNEYFFGEEAHWLDYLWFYGAILFVILVATYVYLQTH